VGLYKLCNHKGRARDRCSHAWWGNFRGKRVSLARWANREIRSKAEANKALEELRAAIRDGSFDERGLDPPPDKSPLTFRKFAEVYKQRHVLAKGLALASTIDYRLKPLIERFGDRAIGEIRTADIEDFVADLKKPRVVNGVDGRRLSAASINRTLGLLRHMLNWAVGREYIDRTPFRRGTEVLVRMELEDNKRRRRVSEEEEAALLAVASPVLRSMIIAALDTGMRRGEMLALRFGDIDWKRRLIVLRGATTKSRRTRVVPIGTSRLLSVLEWLRLDSTDGHKIDDVPVFRNEDGEPLKTFKKAWLVAVLKAHGVDPHWRKGAYKERSSASSGFAKSTCTGTTSGMSTPPGWSNEAFRSRRSAISSATHRFSRQSVTTIRSLRHCRLPSSGWSGERRLNLVRLKPQEVRLKPDTTGTQTIVCQKPNTTYQHRRRNRGQSFKNLSSSHRTVLRR
jgi:integrase